MKSLPRLRFAHLPTAVEPLARLGGSLGGEVRLFVKRDDQTGLAMGGNKVRKLEFLLAEAQANGARTLVTAGAAQSNHCRQTAAAAARFDMDCILVLSRSGDLTEEHSASGNLLLDRLFNAEVVWTDRQQRDKVLRDTFQKAWEDGRRPYLIPYGGSNMTGAAGYVLAMQELMQQVQAGSMEGKPPDWIVFASSSGGTQAGLVVGARLFDYPGRILGISVDEHARVLRQRVAVLAQETAGALGEPMFVSPESVLVDDSYLGGGYGVLGDREREAIDLFARREGLLLDPVYTGRAAGGLIDLVRKGYFPPGESVLFWHTGGTPALFANKYCQDV